MCIFVKQIQGYLGNDLVRWNSLVESKSKSIIRIYSSDKAKPTHLKVMEYIKENFYSETKQLVERIVSRVTEKNINDILNKYDENDLKQSKKCVIRRFLLDKVKALTYLYFGKED